MEARSFTAITNLRFRDADPAGILFYGRAYSLAHDAYEDFISTLGFSWKDWFENPTWATPIRNSSCEHLKPLRAGNECRIRVAVEDIGDSSFTLRYELESQGQKSAVVRLVHTFVDKKAFSKMSIPSEVRRRLEPYQG